MMGRPYDYLIVGAGPFGSVFAYEARKRGKRCLLVEKRAHTGGNIYCSDQEGIRIHVYGAHIFHTSDQRIWDYVNQFATFNHFVNSPIANYNGECYNLPFNMNTFNKMWGTAMPQQARAIIEEQKSAIVGEPSNLEEQAIRMVGKDIYQKLVKGYT
ncbi:MAG: NAD(P)-binding protein, partial [Anaerotruncus colihominis]